MSERTVPASGGGRHSADRQVRMLLPNNSTSRFWSNSVPELVKLSRVEECDRANRLAILHPKIPRVRVPIGQSVIGGGGRIEQDDYHIIVGINTVDFWDQWRGHARIEWLDHFLQERLARWVGFR
jgi:hypothetical protein